jgi:hypothetical protein
MAKRIKKKKKTSVKPAQHDAAVEGKLAPDSRLPAVVVGLAALTDQLRDELPDYHALGALSRLERFRAMAEGIELAIGKAKDVFEEADDPDDIDCEAVDIYLKTAVTLTRMLHEAQAELDRDVDAAEAEQAGARQ